MWMKRMQFFLILMLIAILALPTMPASASAYHAEQDMVLADGQFVYGPNVGDFNLKAYLEGSAPHLAKYADDLYGRAEYYSVNPKVYLTLLEVHSHLISQPNVSAVENPFDLNTDGFMAQIDTISNKMTAAYYLHLYNYSALPASERNLQPFITPTGATINAPAETNAGTYAILAGLAATNTQNISTILDNNQPDGFYQTYQRLFAGDDPLDATNHISIPGEIGAAAAPDNLLQLPFLRGLAWKFGGVHDTSGCSGLGANGCQFTDASAIDFYPIGSTWGIDTSQMWVVAAGAGTPTRVSNCYYKIMHSDGWETAYYHLENTQTYSGTVNQNDKIGVIANTEAEATCNGGAASGPHVHFWLRHNGANVAINGTLLAGWSVHSGRWSYDTDHNYMWIERSGIKKYPYGDTVLSEGLKTILKSTFNSNGTEDGWILESGEVSSKGGTLNDSAATLRLGDDAAKKQYRSVVSFSTGALPDTAVITGVTLKVKQQGMVGSGNPLTIFQGLMVDVKNGLFGTAPLLAGDFQAVPSKSYGPFSPALTGGWYSMNLSGVSINKLAATQIRLRFKLDDNNNTTANYLSLYSGNATATDRPQLVVTYYVP